MVDLDHFKSINDSFGHLVGDAVLRQMGELLREQARTVDVVARYGGEEFVIVVPDTDVEGGVVFAERLRERIEKHKFSEGDLEVAVTVSIGVADVVAGKKRTVNEILKLADDALYRAKADGRNRVRS